MRVAAINYPVHRGHVSPSKCRPILRLVRGIWGRFVDLMAKIAMDYSPWDPIPTFQRYTESYLARRMARLRERGLSTPVEAVWSIDLRAPDKRPLNFYANLVEDWERSGKLRVGDLLYYPLHAQSDNPTEHGWRHYMVYAGEGRVFHHNRQRQLGHHSAAELLKREAEEFKGCFYRERIVPNPKASAVQARIRQAQQQGFTGDFRFWSLNCEHWAYYFATGEFLCWQHRAFWSMF